MGQKLGFNPNFVRYFSENNEHHSKVIWETIDKIFDAVKVVLLQEEINSHDEDYLVGLLMLYDCYLNVKFEF
jgi:hypothetical protein